MRDFNKLHVISLPRCATVSMCDGLAWLGVHVSHLGKIQGDDSELHYDASRLIRIHEQITTGDYDLDILKDCDGMADYPACIAEVFEALDQKCPGSLFINVRRDWDIQSWLQSAERQFIGLQMLKTGQGSTPEESTRCWILSTSVCCRSTVSNCCVTFCSVKNRRGPFPTIADTVTRLSRRTLRPCGKEKSYRRRAFAPRTKSAVIAPRRSLRLKNSGGTPRCDADFATVRR